MYLQKYLTPTRKVIVHDEPKHVPAEESRIRLIVANVGDAGDVKVHFSNGGVVAVVLKPGENLMIDEPSYIGDLWLTGAGRATVTEFLHE